MSTCLQAERANICELVLGMPSSSAELYASSMRFTVEITQDTQKIGAHDHPSSSTGQQCQTYTCSFLMLQTLETFFYAAMLCYRFTG